MNRPAVSDRVRGALQSAVYAGDLGEDTGALVGEFLVATSIVGDNGNDRVLILMDANGTMLAHLGLARMVNTHVEMMVEQSMFAGKDDDDG